MSTTETPAADVNAAVNADDKSTATTTPSVDETKKTSTSTGQENADKEILKDLETADKEKAKEDGDVADDTDEDQKPEDSEEDEANSKNADDEKAEAAKGAEARKQALQTEIRELVSKRNELRAEVEQQNAKVYRVETAEELAEQGLTEEEAQNEILRQEMEMREFNLHVADLNANLNIEALQVMQDFPVFDPDSSEFDETLRDRVRVLYEQAAQPQVDKRTGLVLKSNIAPYEFYKAFAETHASSGAKSRIEGKIEGQKAADKQLAAAETPSSTAPRAAKEDPFLKGLLSKDD